MTARRFTDTERRYRLATRHRLVPDGRSSTLAGAVDAVVALHSSDPATVYLSAAARMLQPSIADIERDLYVDRTVFRHHAMRRTLWVMSPDTASAAHAACTLKVARSERRRFLAWLEATDGIEHPELWLEAATVRVLAFLDENGPATTREVGVAIPELTFPITVGRGTRQETTIAAHSRVLLLAGLDGLAVRGPTQGSWIASQYRWHTAAGWGLPELDRLEPREGAAELLRRVLDRFGPATTEDLRWWTGWTVAMLARALGDVGAAEVTLDSGGVGWVNPGDSEPPIDPGPWVELLAGLDPTPMGWKSRDWFLSEELSRRVFDRNGNAGPTVWVDGVIAGGWAQRPDGEIALDLETGLTMEHQRLLDDAISRLAAFVGEYRFRVRFPSPNQRFLLG